MVWVKKNYLNRYRINTVRYKGWNKNSYGLFFITINTKNRSQCLSNIKEHKNQLSAIGLIVLTIILHVSSKFKNALVIDFVIMPDHVHLLIQISKPNFMKMKIQNSVQLNGGITGLFNPMFYDSISKIIRWLKGRTCFEIRKIDQSFAWQRSFHSTTIFSDVHKENVIKYIKDNVDNWNND